MAVRMAELGHMARYELENQIRRLEDERTEAKRESARSRTRLATVERMLDKSEIKYKTLKRAMVTVRELADTSNECDVCESMGIVARGSL